jgi:hypothetical protein
MRAINWAALIDQSGLSDNRLAQQLNKNGCVYSAQAINKLRTGRTKEPSYRVGQELIFILKEQTRDAPSIIENSRTR